MNKWLIFISILSLSSFSFANSNFETELRSECAKVKSYANSGRKFYDQKQYQNALGQFQQQASWSAFCAMHSENSGVSFSENAIATAFNNVGLSYFKSGKPQWARAWFSVFPQAKSSQFNLKQLPPPQKLKTWQAFIYGMLASVTGIPFKSNGLKILIRFILMAYIWD